MIVDIGNEVFTKLKNDLSDIKVLTDYPKTTPSFPCVTFAEIENVEDEESVDSSGATHTALSFQVDIYSNAQNPTTEVKAIRRRVDAILSDFYGMRRNFSNPVPNFAGASIYRYTLRYGCMIDKNKKIYRR